MGSGISILFAVNKYKVKIYAIDETEEQVKSKLKTKLEILYKKGIMNNAPIELVLNNIHVTDQLYEATEATEVVIECIPEDLELKQNLIQVLDTICGPEVILASNTSVLSITEIAATSKHKDRIVGTHFWNPPYLIPLVEVVKTNETSEETMDRIISILEAINKRPIRVNKDVPGFVANRLQHALWREAISIVENGIADAKTVDEAIKYSFGQRLSILGPLENADMVGTDLTLAIHNYIFKYLEDTKEPSQILIEMAMSNEKGFKTQKGFYQWDENKIQDIENKLLDHLIKINYEY